MPKTWTQVVLLNLAFTAAGLRVWLSPTAKGSRRKKSRHATESALMVYAPDFVSVHVPFGT